MFVIDFAQNFELYYVGHLKNIYSLFYKTMELLLINQFFFLNRIDC